MHTGCLQEGLDWYYLDASGRMISNEARIIDGVPYTFGVDGKLLRDHGIQVVTVTRDQMDQWFYATYAMIANSTSWNEDYFKSSFGTWQFEAKYRL